jgi:hypothetical protein
MDTAEIHHEARTATLAGRAPGLAAVAAGDLPHQGQAQAYGFTG